MNKTSTQYDTAVASCKDIFIKKIVIQYKGITTAEEDVLVMQSNSLLETITGQKSNIIGTYKYIGPTKKFFFKGFVTLRKEQIFIFFNYLSTCCIPIYIKRNGVEAKDFIMKSTIKLVDLNIFFNFKNINIKGILDLKFYGENTVHSLGDLLQLLKIQ